MRTRAFVFGNASRHLHGRGPTSLCAKRSQCPRADVGRPVRQGRGKHSSCQRNTHGLRPHRTSTVKRKAGNAGIVWLLLIRRDTGPAFGVWRARGTRSSDFGRERRDTQSSSCAGVILLFVCHDICIRRMADNKCRTCPHGFSVCDVCRSRSCSRFDAVPARESIARPSCSTRRTHQSAFRPAF